MHLQGVLNEIIFRAFPTSLKGPARVWFSKLTPNTLSTFKELSGQFVTHFIEGKRYKRSSTSLLNIKQREDKCLRSYATQFNKEALLIDEVDDKVLVTAFTNGLQFREFLFSIYKNALKIMDDLLYKATKYMNAKVAMTDQRGRSKKKERQDDSCQDRGKKYLKQTNEGTRKDQDPHLARWQISPHWIQRLTKSSCRYRTTKS